MVQMVQIRDESGGRREWLGFLKLLERWDGLLFVKLDGSVRKKMLSRAQLATKPLHGR